MPASLYPAIAAVLFSVASLITWYVHSRNHK